MSGWLWGTSQLDEAIDKATSELIPSGQEDIALNLEICDKIRSKSVPVKDAMRALKRRLNHKNPNVQILALSLTDVCIKNGGDHFLTEISSREFIDNLVSILKFPALNNEVKERILRYIQNWSVALEGKPAWDYVGSVYKVLKSEGFTFPPPDAAVANALMTSTSTAPEWIDSDVCLRCRTAFSFTNRKHHCRNCGQVFDQSCSSKTMPLPHFGIIEEVRVCDGCLTKLGKKQGAKQHHSSSVHSPSSTHNKSARDFADLELQRAIQLSLEQVAPSSRPSQCRRDFYSEPPLVDRSTHPAGEEDDPELKAAIEASLREIDAARPSAPVETPRSEYASYSNYAYPTSVALSSTQYEYQPSAPPSNELEPETTYTHRSNEHVALPQWGQPPDEHQPQYANHWSPQQQQQYPHQLQQQYPASVLSSPPVNYGDYRTYDSQPQPSTPASPVSYSVASVPITSQYPTSLPISYRPPQSHSPTAVYAKQNHSSALQPSSQPQQAHSAAAQVHYQQQQQPQYQYTPPTPQLPQFPVVPTTAPHVFSTYESHTEREERNEALLIEL